MIRFPDLAANFAGSVALSADLFRCEDVTPKSTYFYYVKPAAREESADLLMVVENVPDDEFAKDSLSQFNGLIMSETLATTALASNVYQFTHMLFAPSSYHQYFRGLLDSRRDRLVLCLPIHRCEFSGTETVEEFNFMRRHTIDSLNWTRAVAPKIVLRFRNPRTGGGTERAIVRYDLLLREIENLEGVAGGFIECQNWQARTIEILSPEEGRYVLIRDRNDAAREEFENTSFFRDVWRFLSSE